MIILNKEKYAETASKNEKKCHFWKFLKTDGNRLLLFFYRVMDWTVLKTQNNPSRKKDNKKS